MGGTPQNLNVCWESNEFPNHRRNVGFLSSSWDALFRFVDAAMRYVTEINERCGSKLSLEPQRTGDIFVMGWIRFFWFHMLFLWLGDDSIPFLVSDFRQLKPSLLEPSDWSSRWAADAASDRGWNTLSSKLSRSFELQVPLSNEDLMTPTAWWFGTFGLFFHILGIVCPTDFHIFQKGWNHQPAKSWWRHGGHGVFDERSPRGPPEVPSFLASDEFIPRALGVPGTNPAADWKTRRCFWTTCSWFKRWELSAESATRWEDKRGKAGE